VSDPVDRKLPAIPKRKVALTTAAFPGRPPDLQPNPKLQAALGKAIDAGPGKSWRVALAIADIDGATHVAHVKGDVEMFGASMIKVAALHGVLELRRTVRAIAAELGTNTSQAELLKDAAQHLNPLILKKVDDLPALKPIKQDPSILYQALPLYAKLFKVDGPVGGPFNVDFTPDFAMGPSAPGWGVTPTGKIEKMITLSKNESTADCIHACGYGYLNGALAAAGLFEPKTGTGLWLARDYVDTYKKFLIDSKNDQLVGQAGTALHTMRLLTLAAQTKLFGGDTGANRDMLTFLEKGAQYAAESVWIDKGKVTDGGGNPVTTNFKITHNKIGFANLKDNNDKGARVNSECSILVHTKSKKRFALAWLNWLWTDISEITKLVHDTLEEYTK